METGVIIKSVGSSYKVLCRGNRFIDCVLKGKFREKELRSTNPIAVGDNVRIEIDEKNNSGIITELLDRRNYILRKASNLSKHTQIIAANIDQVFIMVTIIMPETPVEFIDRFLVTAEAYRIPAKIIFNKTDIYGTSERVKMEDLISLYKGIGYDCVPLSVNTGINLDILRDMMKDKVNLVAGNSGVGKSSLLNALNPLLKLKTEEISDYHKQGKHITTFPEMHILPSGGFVIDTPGIKGFGLVYMERNEIYHFFPEIFRYSKDCKFHNCLHLDEPCCAVRNAVKENKINILRYRSYKSILNDGNAKYR